MRPAKSLLERTMELEERLEKYRTKAKIARIEDHRPPIPAGLSAEEKRVWKRLND